MYDTAELKQRFVIIEHSSLDDAKILDQNYMQLIKDAYNPEEQQQLRILRTNVRRRIERLTETNGSRSN
jgi:hypothetical protein